LKRIIEQKGLTLVPLKFYLERVIDHCEFRIAKEKSSLNERKEII